jgi:hypothetical protein
LSECSGFSARALLHEQAAVLRRIFGPKEKDSGGRMGKIHNKELLKLFITKY